MGDPLCRVTQGLGDSCLGAACFPKASAVGVPGTRRRGCSKQGVFLALHPTWPQDWWFQSHWELEASRRRFVFLPFCIQQQSSCPDSPEGYSGVPLAWGPGHGVLSVSYLNSLLREVLGFGFCLPPSSNHQSPRGGWLGLANTPRAPGCPLSTHLFP